MDTVKFKTTLNKRKNVCTECTIVRDGNVIAVGSTTLYAKDTYDKVLGQKIALSRALTSIKRPERKQFWDWFFKHSKMARKKYANILA